MALGLSHWHLALSTGPWHLAFGPWPFGFVHWFWPALALGFGSGLGLLALFLGPPDWPLFPIIYDSKPWVILALGFWPLALALALGPGLGAYIDGHMPTHIIQFVPT